MIVKFGNWIFRYRNVIFPVFYMALFIPSPAVLPQSWAIWSGSVIIAAGIFVRSITIGLEYIIRGGYKGKIHAANLVTGGIYSICRNPMYLGNILLILGFGIFANSAIFIFLFFPVFLIIYYAIIKAEETFLSEKFGEEYAGYKSKVRALVPALGKIRSAFKGYRFNWLRVLLREYNSLYLYLSGIELLLFYKGIIGFIPALILLADTFILYGFVKTLKKVRYSDYMN